MHDIDRALAQGIVGTLINAGVEWVFDAVLPRRHVVRMREQGWLMFLIFGGLILHVRP